MTLRKLLFFYSVLLIYIITRTIYGAEHTDTSTEDKPGDKDRPAAETKMKDEDIKTLAAAFGLSESLFKSRYSEKIFAATEKARKEKNETDIAKLVAELMGTLNESQVKKLIEETEKTAVNECEATPGDSKVTVSSEIMARFLWAGKVFVPGDLKKKCDPKETRTKFVDEFKKAFDAGKEKRAEFYEKLRQAKEGNEAAKEFLRKNYEPEALLQFLDAQRSNGNEKLSQDLAQALAFKNEGGNHFFDVNEPSGTVQRINLGSKPEEFNESLRQFSTGRTGGFGGLFFRPAAADKPDKEFKPTAKPEVRPTPPKKEEKKEEKKEDPKPPTTGLPANEAAFKAIMVAKCVRCHGPGKSQEDAFAMNTDGTPKIRNGATITRILQRSVKDADDPMPPSGLLAEDSTKVIKEWAKLQGVE